jgi:nucleoside-diphosphate-sugar epimerase
MNEGVCAITGANGYVGSVVARWFTNRGWKVVALTRDKCSEPYLQVPFSLGSSLEPGLFQANKITTLIHCAYDFRAADWSSIRKINVEGSAHLLWAAKQGGVRKIVFISSISAFRGCTSMYGKAKLEIESLVAQSSGAIVRPGLVYGDTSSGGMFGALRNQVRSQKIIPLIGSGDYPQYLLHEVDLCTLLESITEGRLNITKEPITAACSDPWPLRTLLLHIAKRENRSVRFVQVPWRFAWASLRCMELLGARLEFRSDSIISLVRQNPSPEFASEKELGFSLRRFS